MERLCCYKASSPIPDSNLDFQYSGFCAPGVISKREADGIVLVDGTKYHGYRECANACPFGVTQFEQAGILQLFGPCIDRRARGSQPICTDACPKGARRC